MTRKCRLLRGILADAQRMARLASERTLSMPAASDTSADDH